MRKKKQLQWMSDDLLNIEMAIRDLHAFLTDVWTEINKEMKKNKKSEE